MIFNLIPLLSKLSPCTNWPEDQNNNAAPANSASVVVVVGIL